jgi:hypothetical protein
MASPKTRGRCGRCGKDFANAGMGKHLASCFGAGPALHVVVDVGPGTWWLHLALASNATLRDLDGFLRETWLECCGHLSAYEIGGTRFESHPNGEYGPRARSMAAKAATVLAPGATFRYEYDFGSTTELRGRVVGSVEASRKKVALLAQNDAIPWPCDACTATATRVCPCCGGMACASCEAPCNCAGSFEDEHLPVVNSPRMGVCGYVGQVLSPG